MLCNKSIGEWNHSVNKVIVVVSNKLFDVLINNMSTESASYISDLKEIKHMWIGISKNEL